jgi:hypothetical protein
MSHLDFDDNVLHFDYEALEDDRSLCSGIFDDTYDPTNFAVDQANCDNYDDNNVNHSNQIGDYIAKPLDNFSCQYNYKCSCCCCYVPLCKEKCFEEFHAATAENDPCKHSRQNSNTPICSGVAVSINRSTSTVMTRSERIRSTWYERGRVQMVLTKTTTMTRISSET